MSENKKPFIEGKIKGNIKDNSNPPPKPKIPPPAQPKMQMKYSYRIDLNSDYPYIQETDVPSEKTITWKLEEILLQKNEIILDYQDSWSRIRKWLQENHPELLI